jgi:hypothetical protein
MTAVEQHRGPVGEDEKRLLSGSRMDEMDIKFTAPPSGILFPQNRIRERPARRHSGKSGERSGNKIFARHGLSPFFIKVSPASEA